MSWLGSLSPKFKAFRNRNRGKHKAEDKSQSDVGEGDSSGQVENKGYAMPHFPQLSGANWKAYENISSESDCRSLLMSSHGQDDATGGRTARRALRLQDLNTGHVRSPHRKTHPEISGKHGHRNDEDDAHGRQFRRPLRPPPEAEYKFLRQRSATEPTRPRPPQVPNSQPPLKQKNPEPSTSIYFVPEDLQSLKLRESRARPQQSWGEGPVPFWKLCRFCDGGDDSPGELCEACRTGFANTVDTHALKGEPEGYSKEDDGDDERTELFPKFVSLSNIHRVSEYQRGPSIRSSTASVSTVTTFTPSPLSSSSPVSEGHSPSPPLPVSPLKERRPRRRRATGEAGESEPPVQDDLRAPEPLPLLPPPALRPSSERQSLYSSEWADYYFDEDNFRGGEAGRRARRPVTRRPVRRDDAPPVPRLPPASGPSGPSWM